MKPIAIIAAGLVVAYISRIIYIRLRMAYLRRKLKKLTGEDE